MKIRVNRHRLTVTAEIDASSPLPDEQEQGKILARTKAILDSLVAAGAAESAWLNVGQGAVLDSEPNFTRYVLIGVGLPATPGLQAEAASAFDRMRGVAMALTLPPRPTYGDPRLAVALSIKLALQMNVPVDSLEMVDVAHALWTAGCANVPQTFPVRFRTRQPATTTLSDHLRLGALGEDATVVAADRTWARSASFVMTAEDEHVLVAALLDESLGFSRQDVRFMTRCFARELRQTSNWAATNLPEISVALFPRRRSTHKTAAPRLRVEISPDRMSCRVRPPAVIPEGTEPLSEHDVRAQIRSHGVPSVRDEAIAEITAALAKREPFVIVVAEGKPAVAARDPYPCRLRDPSGRGFKTMTQAWEKVAVVAHLVPSSEGQDVTGKEVLAPPPEKDHVTAGEGVIRTDDAFFAKIAGSVVVKDMTVSVLPVRAIAGSLTSLNSPVHSDESLSVAGQVEPGASLAAGGGIEIGQSFAGASLRAGGDLQVQGGMTGDRSSLAVVAGSVRVKFFQGGRLRCKGNVVIESNMTGGIVETGGDVNVVAADGGIFGGTVMACGSVTAANLGRGAPSGLTVWFGTDPRQASRKSRLEHRRKVLGTALGEVHRAGIAIKGPGGERAKRTESRSIAVKRREKLERILRRIDDALEGLKLAAVEGCVVRVAGTIRQGTRLASGTLVLVVKEDTAAVEAKVEFGAIVLKKATSKAAE